MKPGFNESNKSQVKKTALPETETIQELIEIMHTVDLKSSEAILNATTISDGRGGRIVL